MKKHIVHLFGALFLLAIIHSTGHSSLKDKYFWIIACSGGLFFAMKKNEYYD